MSGSISEVWGSAKPRSLLVALCRLTEGKYLVLLALFIYTAQDFGWGQIRLGNISYHKVLGYLTPRNSLYFWP